MYAGEGASLEEVEAKRKDLLSHLDRMRRAAEVQTLVAIANSQKLVNTFSYSPNCEKQKGTFSENIGEGWIHSCI